MAAMCDKDVRNTNEERVFKQAGHKCAYLHEVQNRINNMADLWNIFDQYRKLEQEVEENAMAVYCAFDAIVNA